MNELQAHTQSGPPTGHSSVWGNCDNELAYSWIVKTKSYKMVRLFGDVWWHRPADLGAALWYLAAAKLNLPFHQ